MAADPIQQLRRRSSAQASAPPLKRIPVDLSTPLSNTNTAEVNCKGIIAFPTNAANAMLINVTWADGTTEDNVPIVATPDPLIVREIRGTTNVATLWVDV